MAVQEYSTTLLHKQQPHHEVCFTDSVEYRCSVRVLSVRPDNAITSLYFKAILSTGDLYSVVFPFQHKDGIQVISKDVPVPFTPTWFGIACDVVQLRIGLYVLESPHPRPLILTALLPRDPDDIPDDVPPLLRLGAEFLLSNRAEVLLPAGSEEGRLKLPY